MSLLASLVRAYDRLPDAPPFGYSSEKIGFCIMLDTDGTVTEVIDLRDTDKKRSPRVMLVPQAVKRASNIAPNFLWDKSAYVLGVAGDDARRIDEVHAAFRARHLEWLADAEDEGLAALRRFLESWTPEAFAPPLWPEEMRDQNIVFRLAGEFGFLHDRPAARALWASVGAEGASDSQICLVTGTPGPVARLHPSIKGVWGAQSSGASLISFNLDAFTSYGHEQGDNAPVSEAATFAYTTALNRFLADPKHRLQIGDASTVFWADAENMESAAEAEAMVTVMLAGPSRAGADEKIAETRILDKLKAMRDGRPLREIAPDLDEGVRFCVLGLAPNAARLSVRFWWEDSFGALAAHYAAFLRDVAIEPAPDQPVFSIRAAALRSAPAEVRNGQLRYDGERVSPLLAGELTRAILTGGRFPRSLLGLLVLRIRSDHVLDRIRLSLIKGIIVRDMRLEGRLPRRPDGTVMEDYLMHPDPDDPDMARRLGRLFALIERAQLAALGDGLNATVKDKFLGAAAATPGRVLPGLLLNAENHHLKRLRNGHSDATWIRDATHAKAVAAGLGREIGTLWGTIGSDVPAQLSAEEQGRFLVGYYQERYARRADTGDTPAADAPQTEEAPQ
ncbi:type I-C CRISPR-associated protein Cas8c/Csd1 [Paenirhodobacter enshiensis]|uniref:type I-C CRISPR-associated protein Cas8c/Csd1 n=1 Tax=Paenirhodobacter enshiensis TaxID=1105367 RepID=UPI003FA1D687